MLEIMVIFYGNICLFFISQRIGGIAVVEIIEKEPFSVIGIHYHVLTAPDCFVKERMCT